MGLFSILNYLRLKVIVTFIRLIAKWQRRRLRAAQPGPNKKQISIPSRDPGRFIEGYLYTPPETPGSPANKKKPILVNWHGSGFVVPSLGLHDVYCARVARDSGINVLDVDYRKGPEAPFPAAVHDTEDVLKWVAGQGDQFDISRVVVSGFSAGGNLALVAASVLRSSFEELKLQIPMAIAIYPVVDITVEPAQKVVPKPIRPIPAFLARIFNDSYTPNPESRKDPRVSPALADPSSFPGTVVIVTCEGDTLAPESNALAERLKDGKRKVVHKFLEDVGHGFDDFCREGSKAWEQREAAYGLIVHTINEEFGHSG
ncbi:hypothetical protein VTN49DRAFT_6080 [Thermomyces lanuginosus]|uniref:Esterase n=1 Tax=Thermomyces lanuginosus TaxID=5541 RepID=W8DVW0_THELA|nr:esterase [Thermomyces lanuginosus]